MNYNPRYLFERTQYEFIKQTHYDRTVKDMIKVHPEFNPNEKPRAIKDIIWSLAVQHGSGGANSIMNKALEDSKTLTDEQLIDRIYEERVKHIEYSFRGKKPVESNPEGPIHRRYIREKQKALEMLRNEL